MTFFKSSLAVALSLVTSFAIANPVHIKVGVVAGPSEDITKVVASVAHRYNIEIEPVLIEGVMNPNVPLSSGDIQANFFQHQLYLNAEIANRGYALSSITQVYHSPLAFYSYKYHKLSELPEHALVSIPDDNANQSRALLALQDNGLIKLKDGADSSNANVSLADITENPRHLNFKELSWAILPRSFQDVDAGGINATHAYRLANLKVSDAIGVENPARTAKYASVVVVRTADKSKPWAAELAQAYNSPEVAQYIKLHFDGVLSAAFVAH